MYNAQLCIWAPTQLRLTWSSTRIHENLIILHFWSVFLKRLALSIYCIHISNFAAGRWQRSYIYIYSIFPQTICLTVQLNHPEGPEAELATLYEFKCPGQRRTHAWVDLKVRNTHLWSRWYAFVSYYTLLNIVPYILSAFPPPSSQFHNAAISCFRKWAAYNAIPWLCVEKDRKQISYSKRLCFVNEVGTKKMSFWIAVVN